METRANFRSLSTGLPHKHNQVYKVQINSTFFSLNSPQVATLKTREIFKYDLLLYMLLNILWEVHCHALSW